MLDTTPLYTDTYTRVTFKMVHFVLHNAINASHIHDITRTSVCAQCNYEYTSHIVEDWHNEYTGILEVMLVYCRDCLIGPLADTMHMSNETQRRIFIESIRRTILNNDKYKRFLDSSITDPSSRKVLYVWKYRDGISVTHHITPDFIRDEPPPYTP